MLRNDCIEQHVEGIARVKSLSPQMKRTLFSIFDDPFNISGIVTADINFLIKIGLVEMLDDGDYQISKNWMPDNFRTVDFDAVKGIAISHSIANNTYSSRFTYHKAMESNP